MAHRSSYWSNSKLADFIRGNKKPGALTASGWTDWEKASREKHPIRYWIAETAFDKMQNAVWWPIEKLYNFKYYWNNRFITKTHALTSATLRKGAWAEFGTRYLHCTFDELVNFVEIESAWKHIAWSTTDRKKYKTPWYAAGWWRWRTWRSAEAGLDHLYWAAALTYDQNMGVGPGSEYYGKPTPQAQTARETLALYHWWKNVRPARPDPHQASGWAAICDAARAKNPDAGVMAMLDHRNETAEEAAASKAALDKTREIEESYEKEDEDMSVRLAKLAPKLWT
jgi:hypothetical protein